jgi:hypothetical protein
MTESTETQAVDENLATSPETEQQGAATEAAETANAPESTPAGETKAKQNPWYLRRIAEEADKRRALEAELAALRSQPGNTQQQAQQPDNFQEAVRAEAARLAEQEKHQRIARETYERGVSEFPDYKEAVSSLTALGEPVNSQAFLETVFDMDDAHAVIHHLGTNIDLADEVLSLPPLKMARRLEKIAADLKAKPKTSATAQPVKHPPAIDPLGKTVSTATSKRMEDWTPAEWDEYYRKKRNGG